MSGSTGGGGVGHSGTGGVDSNIALQAGRGIQNNGLMTQSPHEFANTLSSFNQLSLFPLKKQELQQQLELQRLGITKGGIENQGAQIGLDQTKRAIVNGAATSLLSYGDNLQLSHFTNLMGQLEAQGIDTSSLIKAVTASGASSGQPLRQVIAAAVGRALPVGEALKQHVGTQTTRDTGQEIQSGVEGGLLSNQPGAFTPAGTPTQTYPSRTQLGQQVTWEDNQGVKHYTTDAEYRKARGLGQTSGPAINAPQGAPASTPPAETAAPPGSSAAAPPKAAPAPAAGLTDTTGAPPGFKEEVETSQRQYKDAADADASYKQSLTPLQQAEAALKSAKTGPGTDTANLIQSYILTWAPPGVAKKLGIDADKVADFDLAVKSLAQTALGQPGALTSDMRTSLSQVANASTKIQNAAAQHVVQIAIGLRNMQHAASYQFDKQYGTSPGVGNQWGGFIRDFNRDYDPRGFYWDSQTREQKEKVIATASDADQVRIAHSIKLAREMGIAGGSSGK